MNPSRKSYFCPIDYKQAYSKYVILSPCEFCNRTFIPDSLIKHRKICYKDYLKKKSHDSKRSTLSRSKSVLSNCSDLPGMSCSELMLKRQIRRMHWRSRHEEFIQSITKAREYVSTPNNGVKGPAFTISIDSRDNMQQCKYCLRNFQKDNFEKHLKRCKEYSIKSLRCKPNEAQIEAKRRLSLRLYYKPKSFRGDSPDDLSTTISSNDFDCQSTATVDSQNIINCKSRASSSVSICGITKIKKQNNVSIPKSQSTVLKRRKSTVLPNSTEIAKSPCNSVKYSNSKSDPKIKGSRSQLDLNRNKIAFGRNDDFDLSKVNRALENQKTLTRNKINHRIIIDDCESVNSIQCNRSNKNHLKGESMNLKLKVISNIFNSSINHQKVITSDFYDTEILSKYDLPNPAESLNKAKEILKFLDVQMQEKEIYSRNYNLLLDKNLFNDDSQLNKNFRDPLVEYLERRNYFKIKENSFRTEISSENFANNSYKSNVTPKHEKRINTNYDNLNIIKKRENKYENLFKNVNVNETMNFDSWNNMNKSSEKTDENNSLISDKSQSIPDVLIVHCDPEYTRIWKK